MPRILITEDYEKEYAKLDNNEQIRIKKIIKQLKEKGFGVGKPLSGLSFFKEKKFDGKRLYYLEYKNFDVILIIAISDKKTQQVTINRILIDLAEYQQYVIKKLQEQTKSEQNTT